MATWMGPAPTNCDTCGTKITNKFYDAKTEMGPWGCMCPSCQNLGPGLGKLGTGFGQEYTKQKDGKWLKTAG
jgi:hypothetical protein